MNHIKVHNAPVDWEACINCGKQFARKGELRMHMKKKVRYHDDHCTWTDTCPEVRFESYQEHLDHVKAVHEGQFAFRCSFCPSVFPSETLKRRHMKATHTINTGGSEADTN